MGDTVCQVETLLVEVQGLPSTSFASSPSGPAVAGNNIARETSQHFSQAGTEVMPLSPAESHGQVTGLDLTGPDTLLTMTAFKLWALLARTACAHRMGAWSHRCCVYR
jgi:hypothetical protein